MTSKIDFRGIGQQVLAVLDEHGIPPTGLDVGIALPSALFDQLFSEHPNLVEGGVVMIRVEITHDLWYFIQIARQRDMPPEMILQPPEEH